MYISVGIIFAVKNHLWENHAGVFVFVLVFFCQTMMYRFPTHTHTDFGNVSAAVANQLSTKNTVTLHDRGLLNS